jgi:tellurite resistance protein
VERLVTAKPNLFAIPFGIAGLAIVWRLMAGAYDAPLAVTDALSLIALAIWLPLTLGALRRWATVRGSLGAEIRDPVYSPFLALPAIIGMMLAVGLGLHGTEPAKTVFLVFFALTIGFGGWLTGEWVLGEIDEARFHPGYYLPTCAGGFIGAEGCGLFGMPSLGWIAFGLGVVSWLILASQVSGRLFFISLLPAGLVPTMAIELATPCVAGAAYFQLHGEAPDPVAYSLAGYAALMLLVQVRLLPVYARLRFSVGFWSFTFSWCAAAALGIRWLEATDPPRASTWAAVVAAGASLLVVAVALRSFPRPPPDLTSSSVTPRVTDDEGSVTRVRR